MGKPIIIWQIELLKKYGMDNIGILAGHLAHKLSEYLALTPDKLRVNITYFIEDMPLGTAGGLCSAETFIRENDFLLIYGDLVINMDLDRFYSFHIKKKALASIAVHPNDHPYESDLVRTADNDRILQILHRKNRRPGSYRNLVPAGIYFFNSRIFKAIESNKNQDFIKNVFPDLIEKNRPVYAYNTVEYIKDMGTVERYQAVENDIKAGLVHKMNFAVKRPAVFFDRDGVVVQQIKHYKGLVRNSQLKLCENASKAVKTVNDAGWLSALITNQPQVAKGFLSFEGLENIHARLETLLGYDRAKLDHIYYCPHHPMKGFKGEVPELKINCSCRKPKPGMIKKALQELPVSIDESCVIGDTWRDVWLARNVGMYAYGVRTGYACNSCINEYKADLVFRTAYEAVAFAVRGISEAQELVKTIIRLKSKKNKLFIGISGLPCSGKSMLSHEICRNLKKHNINSFHLKMDELLQFDYNISNIENNYRNNAHKTAVIIDNMMNNPENSGILGLDKYSMSLLKDTLKQREDYVIILDSIYACAQELDKYIHFSIYIDTPLKDIEKKVIDIYRYRSDGKNKRYLHLKVMDYIRSLKSLTVEENNNADMVFNFKTMS
jgi:histidinol-phosphate phosphatase family protein